MNKICEILNVQLDKPFNIKGQNFSNPYHFKQDGVFTILYNRLDEEVHNWVVCNLINGTLEIERSEEPEKVYDYMFGCGDMCPNNP